MMRTQRLLASLASLAAAALLLAGCDLGDDPGAGGGSGPGRAATTDSPDKLNAVRGYRSLRASDPAPAPVAVSIPAIGIDGPLSKTGLNDDRTLEVPEYGSMSWFDKGTAPGEPGPAAILGHVDTRKGPDVFHLLHELSKGDEIAVKSKSDKSFVFVVDRVEQHAKKRFPTEVVWLPSAEPQLRLITCGGEFNRAERSYRDNVIVFASLRKR